MSPQAACAYSFLEIKAATLLQVHNVVRHDLADENHYTSTLKIKDLDALLYDPAMNNGEFLDLS